MTTRLDTIAYYVEVLEEADWIFGTSGRRSVRPEMLIFYSYDGGVTARADIRGPLVRVGIGTLGRVVTIPINLHDAPDYVLDAMRSLGLQIVGDQWPR